MNKKPTQNDKKPLWLLLLTLVVVPIIIALINSDLLKSDPGYNKEPCESRDVKILGLAVYEFNDKPIQKASISIREISGSKKPINSDGTFSFNDVEVSCDADELSLVITLENGQISSRLVPLKKNDNKIDLGQTPFSFPFPDRNESKEGSQDDFTSSHPQSEQYISLSIVNNSPDKNTKIIAVRINNKTIRINSDNTTPLIDKKYLEGNPEISLITSNKTMNGRLDIKTKTINYN